MSFCIVWTGKHQALSLPQKMWRRLTVIMESLMSEVVKIHIQLIFRVHHVLVQIGLRPSTHANTSSQCFVFTTLSGLGSLYHTHTLQVLASVLINNLSTSTLPPLHTQCHQQEVHVVHLSIKICTMKIEICIQHSF